MSRAYHPARSALDTPYTFDSVFVQSKGAWIAAGIAILYLVINILTRFDLPFLSPVEYLWNALVYILPTRLILALDKRKNPEMYAATGPEVRSASERHAVKSEALRRVFGLDNGAFLRTLPGAAAVNKVSWLGGRTELSDAPPGLGNWDNSCYQNSVLQGLSALQSLTTFLEQSDATKSQNTATTAGSLWELMGMLNDPENNGRRIWTPTKLKSMSSWQQQDAQEYFSKIMDDMEKESVQSGEAAPKRQGLEKVKAWEGSQENGKEEEKELEETGKASKTAEGIMSTSQPNRNPLDGYLAQRVACLRCGFSEGLSMIPFNCLTVPLGTERSYSIQDCLNEYTSLEEISGVECMKCTLLNQKTQLEHKLNGPPSTPTSEQQSVLTLPPELRTMFADRLQQVQQALDDDDFSDNTISKKCQVPKNARISSTKTRQAVIARAPKSLAIHVNRSSFDIYTGDQRKNLAEVRYPKLLDLQPWCLGAGANGSEAQEQWWMEPSRSIVSARAQEGQSQLQYILRAAVCHYGRHENGHYICYRTHPERATEDEGVAEEKQKPAKWWRLSDDDVSPVTEEHVLGQGGVFMLFYERLEASIPIQPVHALEEAQKEDVLDTVEPATLVEVTEHSEAPKLDEQNTVTNLESVEEILPPTAIPARSDIDETAIEPTKQSAESSDPETPEFVDTPQEIRKTPTPPLMRTSRNGRSSKKRAKDGFSSAFRAVAAT